MNLWRHAHWRRHGKWRQSWVQIKRWYANFAKFRTFGIERAFDTVVVGLRPISLSYLLKDLFLETLFEFQAEPEGHQLTFGFLGEEEKARQKTRRKIRDLVIDAYCIVQFVILLALLYPWDNCWIQGMEPRFEHYLAYYILFEIYLNLSSIFFLAKFTEKPKDINEPSTSVERSLLMLLINAAQIIMCFAVLYKHFMSLPAASAFFQATLVFGTLGYPDNAPRLLVVSQMSLDVVLIVIVFGSVVGLVGPFRQSAGSK